MNKGSTAA